MCLTILWGWHLKVYVSCKFYDQAKTSDILITESTGLRNINDGTIWLIRETDNIILLTSGVHQKVIHLNKPAAEWLSSKLSRHVGYYKK